MNGERFVSMSSQAKLDQLFRLQNLLPPQPKTEGGNILNQLFPTTTDFVNHKATSFFPSAAIVVQITLMLVPAVSD